MIKLTSFIEMPVLTLISSTEIFGFISNSDITIFLNLQSFLIFLNLHLLEQEFQVYIDKNEIPDLRGSDIWIYITRPCNSIIYQSVRNKFMSLLPLALIPEDLLRKYVKKININGKSYVKYPERVFNFI